MFEVRNARNQIRRINQRLKDNELRPLDVAVLLEILETVKDKFDKTEQDIYAIKKQCNGLKNSLYYALVWKKVDMFKNSAVHINNTLVMVDSFLKDPQKALAAYGDIPTIKANISDSLQKLIDSLVVVIKELKEKKKVAKAA